MTIAISFRLLVYDLSQDIKESMKLCHIHYIFLVGVFVQDSIINRKTTRQYCLLGCKRN